jgi:thiol-disulfide isomerase/thioredoxin
VPNREDGPLADLPVSPMQPRPARLWLYVAIGFAVFWAAYLFFFGPRAHAPLENSAMSQPAEYDWTADDLDDRPVAFSKFKGKPLFLNIWATWCGPCVQEMPTIAQLADNPRVKAKNVQFVCISDEPADDIKRFIAGKNWNINFLRANRLPAVFLTDGIPATFLIDAEGQIAASAVGSADWSEPHVVEFLDKLASPAREPMKTGH